MKKLVIALMLGCFGLASCAQQTPAESPEGKAAESTSTESTKAEGGQTVEKTKAEWKAQLTKEEYYVLREQGTEPVHCVVAVRQRDTRGTRRRNVTPNGNAV